MGDDRVRAAGRRRQPQRPRRCNSPAPSSSSSSPSARYGSPPALDLLKDNPLPQIAPMRQTYSLRRWQMTFWFTLIFAAFPALCYSGNYRTITPQALSLMGI